MISFLHTSCPPFLIYKNNSITVRLAVTGQEGELPSRIQLWCFPNNEPAVADMKQLLAEDGFSVYSGEAQLDPSYNQQSYAFRVFLPSGDCRWFSANGTSSYEPLCQDRFTVNLHESSSLWMRDQMFYQIMPDRFASSKIADDVFSTQFEPTMENLRDQRFHGDLKGITGKFDYLQSLGITGIYLNPVTSSARVHGYKCRDYYSVETEIGTEEDLVALIEEAHRRGMKIILDLPVNHVGDDHPYFDRDDLTGTGACHHRDSPYRHFFTFRKDESVHWHYDKELIKLDYSCRKVQNMMYRDDDSVIKHYLKPPFSADGIRLGSAHMLGGHGSANGNMVYIHEINVEAKKVNPECYLLCEHNYDAKPWLCNPNQQGDSTINLFGFYKPMIQFLSGRDLITGEKIRYAAEDFKAFVERYHCGIPHDRLCSLFNLVGNHDSSRIATVLNGNPQLIRIAFTMMYTWIGVPCVYYGDEIGLTGEKDVMARKPMDWNSARDGYKKLLATLAKFRHENRVITQGSMTVTHACGSLLIYERCFARNKTIVIINAGNTVTTADLSSNVDSLRIQQTLASFDENEATPKKGRYNVRGSLMMDNVRIMSIAELDKKNCVRVGPTSALIIQS
ncbi:MAG: hypothetical protein IJ523_00975 [Succinivibrionaceae bacterium]|nr:hypothetical protein [Succinivibrionaceae bacterium]